MENELEKDNADAQLNTPGLSPIVYPTYINPFALLPIKSLTTIELPLLKRAQKQLIAEAQLSDNQAIIHNAKLVTLSYIYSLSATLDDIECLEHHFRIFSAKQLLHFFEDAIVCQELPLILSQNENTVEYFAAAFAESFSISYYKAISKWDYEQLKVLQACIAFISPLHSENAYRPSEKFLVNVAEKLNTFYAEVCERVVVAQQTIKSFIDANLCDTYDFELSVLPDVFYNELDGIAVNIRKIAILAHNKFDHTKLAIQLIEEALEFSKSPSLIEQLKADKKELREFQFKQKSAEVDRRHIKFKKDILAVLNETYAKLSLLGRNKIDSYKLNELFCDIFKPDIITSINKDYDEQFKKEVREYILKFIGILGYNSSCNLISLVEILFANNPADSKALSSAISGAKAYDRSVSFKEYSKKFFWVAFKILSPILAVGLLLFISQIFDFFKNTGSNSPGSNSYKPSTNTNYYSNSSSKNSVIGNSAVEDGFVVVGQYRCSQYHASAADALKPDLVLKQKIETQEAFLNNEREYISTMESRIANIANSLQSNIIDNTDESQVESYNSDVNRYNELLSVHRSRVDVYNKNHDEYNILTNRYNAQVDRYNSYLQSNCTKCAKEYR
jgi:hypothetical protein